MIRKICEMKSLNPYTERLLIKSLYSLSKYLLFIMSVILPSSVLKVSFLFLLITFIWSLKVLYWSFTILLCFSKSPANGKYSNLSLGTALSNTHFLIKHLNPLEIHIFQLFLMMKAKSQQLVYLNWIDIFLQSVLIILLDCFNFITKSHFIIGSSYIFTDAECAMLKLYRLLKIHH